MSQDNEHFDQTKIHTPSTLVGVYSNALTVDLDKELIFLKGLYCRGVNKSYSGYYFDKIKDENGGFYITAKVLEEVRYRVNDGSIYIFKGFTNRQIDKTEGRIKIIYTIADIVPESEQKKPISTVEDKKFEIQRKKSDLGYKNIEEVLKNKLYNNKPPNIALIYGITGIVDDDVKHAMKEASIKYNLKENRINLSSKDEIIKRIDELSICEDRYDVIAIVRGGGSGLEIFDDVDIAEKIVELGCHEKTVFVTAIGHARDTTLLGKIADKDFDTPYALGNYLKEVTERVEEDLAQSRTNMIGQIETYREKVSGLENTLETYQRMNSNWKRVIILLVVIIILILTLSAIL